VVGLEQQLAGVAERVVGREPRRVGMAVRADDRQARHFVVEIARDGPHFRLGREQAIGVQRQFAIQRVSPACVLTGPIAMIALTGEEFRA
jgi:hypothetical protein